MCNAMYMTTHRRNSTDPVDSTCKGVLSSDCVNAMHDRLAPAGSGPICSVDFKKGDLDADACGLEPFLSRGEPWFYARI